MANRVKSSNVIIELLISAVYYPIFCGKTMEFVQTQELVEVTSVNDTISREYEAGMTTASLTITGVTVLNNTGGRIAIAYLMQESIRRAAQSMRIRLIDDDGTAIQIAFSALITSNTLSRQFGTYSGSATTLTVTGEPVITAILPPGAASCVEDPLYLAFAAGQTSVHSVLLEQTGIVILEVEREGTGHDQTNGTPGNRQFKFTGGSGNGTVAFDPTNPSNGETVYVLYKLT